MKLVNPEICLELTFGIENRIGKKTDAIQFTFVVILKVGPTRLKFIRGIRRLSLRHIQRRHLNRRLCVAFLFPMTNSSAERSYG